MLRTIARAVLPRATLARTAPSAVARFSSFPSLREQSQDKLLENLVGGKAGIARRQAEFADKYRAALEAKAQQEGVSVEELKARAVRKLDVTASIGTSANKASKGPVEAGSMDTRKSVDELAQPEIIKPLPSAEEQQEKKAPLPAQAAQSKESPIKPLNDILDLSKATELTTSALSQLWTSYHQAKGFLSAAIPTETYLRMLNSGRKYPIFVLPLTRKAELPDGNEESATEMHLLEWSVLPPPSTATEPIPNPSTVLFTPLAEYKARQTWAQPYLILTHYTDLSASHDLVLMRGEISQNVSLNAIDAQVLAVRMQLFYNDQNKGGEVEQARRELLRAFHEKPDEFNVQALIELGGKDELQ
ncbi:hypothetical protein JCM8547_006191 [Rhodosporidiobolus lusitaniae]